MKTFLKNSLAVILSALMLTLTLVISVSAASTSAIDESKLSDYRVISEKSYALIGGVTEREIILNNASGDHQQYIFVVEVASDNENVSFAAGYNDGDGDEWKMSTTRDQAHALENTRDINVIASVNGGFYHTGTGEPYGTLVMNGKLVNPASEFPFFGITKDGTPVIRDGYGRTDDLQEAIAGTLLLVYNGKAIAGPSAKLTPRTAVGIRKDGTVILCVNDGRQDPYSYGFDTDEFAEFMTALGCDTALNLDGGASSNLLTQREGTDDIELRNQPSNGYERRLAATLHIFTTAQPTGEFDHITFNEPVFSANLNTTIEIEVYAVDKNGYKTEFPAGGYLELEDSSLGTINGTKFTSGNKTGTTTVNYVLDGEVLASAEIEVYNESAITALFNKITDMFNKIRHLFERLIEEIGERLFGL